MIPTISYSSKKIFINCHIVPWHEKLIETIYWIFDLTGEVIITSGYRTKKIHPADSGVHGTMPLRAVDIRHFIYANPPALRDHINLTWTYDPSRPLKRVAFLHDTGQGMHFHIQVHDRTTKV